MEHKFDAFQITGSFGYNLLPSFSRLHDDVSLFSDHVFSYVSMIIRCSAGEKRAARVLLSMSNQEICDPLSGSYRKKREPTFIKPSLN